MIVIILLYLGLVHISRFLSKYNQTTCGEMYKCIQIKMINREKVGLNEVKLCCAICTIVPQEQH